MTPDPSWFNQSHRMDECRGYHDPVDPDNPYVGPQDRPPLGPGDFVPLAVGLVILAIIFVLVGVL